MKEVPGRVDKGGCGAGEVSEGWTIKVHGGGRVWGDGWGGCGAAQHFPNMYPTTFVASHLKVDGKSKVLFHTIS